MVVQWQQISANNSQYNVCIYTTKYALFRSKCLVVSVRQSYSAFSFQSTFNEAPFVSSEGCETSFVYWAFEFGFDFAFFFQECQIMYIFWMIAEQKLVHNR